MKASSMLIKEKPQESTYTKHDQLYKELIDAFLKEFIEDFFPTSMTV